MSLTSGRPDRSRGMVRLPDEVVARTQEQAVVQRVFLHRGQPALHMAGPHGSGKTLLTAVSLHAAADTARPCYVPCREATTQYQVLGRLTAALTGEAVADGYHTEYLQRQVAAALDDQAAVIVLDDVGFLLRNDGADLLYYLSRLDHDAPVTLVTIGTPGLDLTAALDPRTASSFQPRRLTVPAYTPTEAAEILATHANAVVPQPVTRAAVRRIARQTTNIRLGLHWLGRAAEVHAADAVVTAADIPPLRQDAVQRYRRQLLAAFTRHHSLLLAAVAQVTAERARAVTGRVYDHYATLCRCRGCTPVTLRRVSDFLDHLERLGLIQVDRFHGGTHGKTRKIRLTPLQEL